MTSGNEKAELQRKRKMVVTKGKSKELKQNQNGRVATKESCPATEKKKRHDEKISCTERDCNETKDKAAKERYRVITELSLQRNSNGNEQL